MYISSCTGHSRTVVGIVKLKGGDKGYQLLIFDPSHSPNKLRSLSSSRDVSWESLKMFRKNIGAMKAKQYQIVSLKDGILSDVEFEVSPLIYFFVCSSFTN